MSARPRGTRQTVQDVATASVTKGANPLQAITTDSDVLKEVVKATLSGEDSGKLFEELAKKFSDNQQQAERLRQIKDSIKVLENLAVILLTKVKGPPQEYYDSV